MRMSRAILTAAFAALALFAAAPACKTPVPADVPGEFTFHGVAVHPAAVKALYRSSTGLIDLAAFQTNLEAQQWEDQPGWWVAEFEEDPASGRSPFFAYAAFAGPVSGGAETYILSITFNEGEPADVDNIVLLQKSGTMLGLVRAWTEGSACDGGILAERMEDDNFLYARDLTPIHLLELAVGVPLTLTANEDLESVNDSCVAAANYSYSLTEDRETLLSVRLYDEPLQDEKGRTERYRYQSCFNRLFNDYLAKGKTALLPKEIDQFATEFRDQCLTPDGGTTSATVDK